MGELQVYVFFHLAVAVTLCTASLETGLEKSVDSYEKACNWDSRTALKCKGEMKVIHRKILTKDYFKNNPHMKEVYFKERGLEALKKLPDVYHSCKKLLEDPNGAPPADESAYLKDAGQNYPFKGFAHCLINILKGISKGVMEKDEDAIVYGMDKVVYAYEAACADADEEIFMRCRGQQRHQRRQVANQTSFKGNNRMKTLYFGRWSWQYCAPLLPPAYSTCSQYLHEDKAYAPPPAEEKELLDDKKKAYPFRAYAHCLMHVFKGQAKWSLRPNAQHVLYGIEKVFMAFKHLCQFEKFSKRCINYEIEIKQFMLRLDFKDQPNIFEMFFAKEFSRESLPILKPEYQHKCIKYLHDPGADPPADESDFLQDKDMEKYSFKGLAHCLIHTLRTRLNGRIDRSLKNLMYGMKKVVEAYDFVCQHMEEAWKCDGQQEFQRQQVLNRKEVNGALETQELHFGLWSKQVPLTKLSQPFVDKCDDYLDDPEADPPADESDFLKDTEVDFYPFKGYAHCLINLLREMSGGAI